MLISVLYIHSGIKKEYPKDLSILSPFSKVHFCKYKNHHQPINNHPTGKREKQTNITFLIILLVASDFNSHYFNRQFNSTFNDDTNPLLCNRIICQTSNLHVSKNLNNDNVHIKWIWGRVIKLLINVPKYPSSTPISLIFQRDQPMIQLMLVRQTHFTYGRMFDPR